MYLPKTSLACLPILRVLSRKFSWIKRVRSGAGIPGISSSSSSSASSGSAPALGFAVIVGCGAEGRVGGGAGCRVFGASAGAGEKDSDSDCEEEEEEEDWSVMGWFFRRGVGFLATAAAAVFAVLVRLVGTFVLVAMVVLLGLRTSGEEARSMSMSSPNSSSRSTCGAGSGAGTASCPTSGSSSSEDEDTIAFLPFPRFVVGAETVRRAVLVVFADSEDAVETVVVFALLAGPGGLNGAVRFGADIEELVELEMVRETGMADNVVTCNDPQGSVDVTSTDSENSYWLLIGRRELEART